MPLLFWGRIAVDAAYCYRRSTTWSVCPCVGLSVTIVNPAKTAEPIEMPFELWASGGPKEPCRPIRCSPETPPSNGEFWEGKGRPSVKYRDSVPWAVQKTAEPIEISCGMWTQVGPKKHVYVHIHICVYGVHIPGKYDWTVRVRRRCALFVKFFYTVICYYVRVVVSCRYKATAARQRASVLGRATRLHEGYGRQTVASQRRSLPRRDGQHRQQK